MNFAQIVEDIKYNIINSNERCCIYIAVGSAAHMAKAGELEDLYYHQYPKCLEILKQETNINIVHILIDPMIEMPPFITIDTRKGLSFIKRDEQRYYSNDGKHIVYSLKEAINIKCYPEREGTIDITNELNELNKLAIDENLLLVYHDFTGRQNKLVAEYFDKSIMEHLDHIIYGIGSRGDHGCYIDLLHPTSLFAYIVDMEYNRRDIIRVFNIYYCMYNKLDISMTVDIYPLDYINIITCSIESVLTHALEFFNNSLLCDMRIIYQLMTGKTKLDEFNKYFVDNIRKINCNNNEEFKYLFDNKKYDECFNKLLQLYSPYLDSIIYLKHMTTTSNNLMQYIIEEPNEYNWYPRLKNLVSHT